MNMPDSTLAPTSLAHYLATYPFKMQPPFKPGEPEVAFTAFGRLGFLFIDTPRPSSFFPLDRSKDTYQLSLIIPPSVTDFSVPSQAFVNCASARWANWQTLPPHMLGPDGKLKTFVRDQAQIIAKKKYPGFGNTGKVFEATAMPTDANGRSRPVQVFDHNKQALDPKLLKAGAWAVVHFHLFSKPGPKNPKQINCGIGARIVAVQKVCDDTELISEGADRSRAFGVVAHAGGAAAPSGAPAQAPAVVPGF